MRLFIAIPLPPDVRRAAESAQALLRESGAAGRFVPPCNFHITLHFIGESDRLADLAEAMHNAAYDIRPFVLRLSGFGGFSRGGGHTAFLSLSSDGGELDRLYESLESELLERGFAQNRGRLTPHITLARNVTGDADFILPKQTAAFRAGEIVLFESARGPDGQMRYTPVHKERFA